MGRDILLGKSMPGLAPPAHAATVETPAPTATPDPGTRAFATADGVVLHVPSRNVVAIAYHEAFYRSPLPLAPLGRCVHDYNRTKFKRPRPSPGPRYIVMSSRGRGTRATSAVDVALHTGAVVLSPVTGFVSKVRH